MYLIETESLSFHDKPWIVRTSNAIRALLLNSHSVPSEIIMCVLTRIFEFELLKCVHYPLQAYRTPVNVQVFSTFTCLEKKTLVLYTLTLVFYSLI